MNAGPRNKMFSYSIGYFYDSDNFGNPKGNASAATGRITYLPLYEKDGDRLLHFGFSYSFRNQTENTARFRQSAETFLLPNFVDTHTFVADYLNVFGLETVYQAHHVAIESEYVLSDTHNSNPNIPDPQFSGFYIEAIYTPGDGRQRVYDRDRGIFVLNVPEGYPHFGAVDRDRWLITSRISRIDLNDKNVQGGVMNDFTAGFSWLFSRSSGGSDRYNSYAARSPVERVAVVPKRSTKQELPRLEHALTGFTAARATGRSPPGLLPPGPTFTT